MHELARLVQYYLLNEAGNYRRESLMLEARVYIHPRKLNSLFTFATLSTTFQYNFYFTALSVLWIHKLRHLGSTTDLEWKSAGLDVQHLQ